MRVSNNFIELTKETRVSVNESTRSDKDQRLVTNFLLIQRMLNPLMFLESE